MGGRTILHRTVPPTLHGRVFGMLEGVETFGLAVGSLSVPLLVAVAGPRGAVAGVGGLAKLSPETVKGYGAMGLAGQKTGHLDAKTHELIAVAVAITLRCDGCITVHTEAARKLGATKEEIAEALGVAVSVNAGAAIVYSTRTLDAYEAAAEVA